MWAAWIALLCLAIQATALPQAMRIVLCATVATANLLAGGVFLGFRGGRAVRVLEWAADGSLRVSLGGRAPAAAYVARGSFRCGRAFVVLWFGIEAGGSGRYGVIVPVRSCEPALFRAFCRWLAAGSTRPRRPGAKPAGRAPPGQAATIRLKV